MALLLTGCGDRSDAPPAAQSPAVALSTAAVPSPAPALPTPAAAPPAAAASLPGLALAGVVSFGATNPRSQALLSIGGAPAQVFHPGDTVAAGWTLRSVADDHVLVALGEATRRIDMAGAPAVAVAPYAAASARAAQLAKPLPGFVESAPPRMNANDGQASARNRAFLDAVRERRAQQPSGQGAPAPIPPAQRRP